MTKIYQLITSIQLGGAEMVAFDLVEYCGNNSRDKCEFTLMELFCTHTPYAIAKKQELVSKGIRVVTLHKGRKRVSLLFAPFRLSYYIRKEKPDIIHSHTDLPDFTLSVAMRIFSFLHLKFPKIVRTIHNTQLWRTHHKWGKYTEAAFSGECIVGVSDFALKAYEQLRIKNNLSVSQNRQVIYNGCKVPQPQPHPFLIDNEKINIAFCGRFEDYKGMETLIPAISEIGRRFPNRFVFHIIGDGTYKKQLLQLSLQQDNVFLYDPIPNISGMLYAFDYLFMPSHFEGLGLISIEASLSGVPVIASFVPGLDETLPAHWPLQFHLNNENELYAIFENINNDSYDRESIKKRAYSYVSEKFSHRNMINSYSNLYKKCYE